MNFVTGINFLLSSLYVYMKFVFLCIIYTFKIIWIKELWFIINLSPFFVKCIDELLKINENMIFWNSKSFKKFTRYRRLFVLEHIQKSSQHQTIAPETLKVSWTNLSSDQWKFDLLEFRKFWNFDLLNFEIFITCSGTLISPL